MAFARKAGVIRLMKHVQGLREREGRAEAIVGIDHHGTSEEALRLMLDAFDEVYIIQHPHPNVTFHPKMYLFDGPGTAQALVGSHNLTLGGLERNYEGGVYIDFSLPAESQDWSHFDSAWSAMLPPASPSCVVLTLDLLDQLLERGFVLKEGTIQARPRDDAGSSVNVNAQPLPFKSSYVAPPSGIPKTVVTGVQTQGATSSSQRITTGSVFIIEVNPKPNSEVFLSATAIKQNPGFFGWPWSGLTVPKLSKNKPYPKMDPNPTIRVTAYGADGNIAKSTTIRPEIVLYHNADFRMTVGMELLPFIPPYSLLIFKHADEGLSEGFDYELEIHPDDSPGQKEWIGLCDQTLPSGGKRRARRMGWA